MRTLLALTISLLAINAHAADWDKKIIHCKNNNLELTIKGKASLFDSRNITLVNNGEVVVDESYQAKIYPYSEHNGTHSYPEEFNEIMQYSYKIRPKSIHVESDQSFRISDNTIVFETFSNVPASSGGETRALIVQIRGTHQFVVFAEETQCGIKYLD